MREPATASVQVRKSAAFALALALAFVWIGCKQRPLPSLRSVSVAGAPSGFPAQVQDDLGRRVVEPLIA